MTEVYKVLCRHEGRLFSMIKNTHLVLDSCVHLIQEYIRYQEIKPVVGYLYCCNTYEAALELQQANANGSELEIWRCEAELLETNNRPYYCRIWKSPSISSSFNKDVAEFWDEWKINSSDKTGNWCRLGLPYVSNSASGTLLAKSIKILNECIFGANRSGSGFDSQVCPAVEFKENSNGK